MYSQLGQIDGNQLQVAAALKSAREAQRVELQVNALDPGSSRSQNNLRVGYIQLAAGLFSLGRVDEAWQQTLLALTTGKDERVDGFGAQNLLFWHSETASTAASKGDMNRATLDLAAAERYLAVLKSAKASERARANASGRIAVTHGEIALMTRGDLGAARSEIEQSISARKAIFGDKLNPGAAGFFATQHAMVAELSMALGEYVPAESNLRKALDYFKFNETPSLNDQGVAHDTRALLAIALARQSKFEEAAKVIQPALAFYRLPVVQKTDDETMKYYHARVLHGAALANPAEKSKYLTEAAQRYDSMAPSLRRLKNFARVREEIAREAGKS